MVDYSDIEEDVKGIAEVFGLDEDRVIAVMEAYFELLNGTGCSSWKDVVIEGIKMCNEDFSKREAMLLMFILGSEYGFRTSVSEFDLSKLADEVTERFEDLDIDAEIGDVKVIYNRDGNTSEEEEDEEESERTKYYIG